jgi:hypothetical protein
VIQNSVWSPPQLFANLLTSAPRASVNQTEVVSTNQSLVTVHNLVV